jgi:hypothetical protein
MFLLDQVKAFLGSIRDVRLDILLQSGDGE